MSTTQDQRIEEGLGGWSWDLRSVDKELDTAINLNCIKFIKKIYKNLFWSKNNFLLPCDLSDFWEKLKHKLRVLSS